MFKKYKHKDYRISLTETKERLEVDNNYSKFLMLKMFKKEEDIFKINKLNQFKSLDKQLHFDYLLHMNDELHK